MKMMITNKIKKIKQINNNNKKLQNNRIIQIITIKIIMKKKKILIKTMTTQNKLLNHNLKNLIFKH